MRRMITAFSALAFVGVIAISTPPSAYADGSEDNVTYHTQPGYVEHKIKIRDATRDHRCYNVGSASGEVENDTVADITLYAGPNCTGREVTHIWGGSSVEADEFASFTIK
jgi:hypothetical protein